jgi:hypothetical protein
VYRSPLGDFNMFIETMHKLLGKIDYKNKNLIIGGDFNMHLILTTNMHNRSLIYFKVMVYIRMLNSLLEGYPQLTMYFLI